MNNNFSYDVFLSHSTKDKVAIRQLATRLKNDGLRVWFDEWIIQPGDMLQQKVDEGLASSRVLVLAMSQHAFESEWVTLESGTFLFRDPTNKSRRFIPLRLDDANIIESLRQFAWIDWRTADENQYSKLLHACTVGITEQPVNVSLPLSLDINASVSIGGFPSPISGVAVAKNDGKIVACSVTGLMKIWDSSLNKLASINTEHGSAVWGVSISPDGKYALTCSVDTTIRIWNLETFELANILPTPQKTLWSVQMTPDGQRIITGSADGSVGVYNFFTNEIITVFTGHEAPVYSIAVSSDGTFALSSSRDSTLRIWDLINLQCVGILRGHTSPVRTVAISPDDQKAISGGAIIGVSIEILLMIARHRWAFSLPPPNGKSKVELKSASLPRIYFQSHFDSRSSLPDAYRPASPTPARSRCQALPRG